MKALRAIREQGVERTINGVEIDGDAFPALNNVKWTVTEGGNAIGKVTSAIHSPSLGKNIGFAWLPTGRSTPGTSITIDSEWGTRTGTVVPMPFIDPNKEIPVS
jgi:aminomethyltransferase